MRQTIITTGKLCPRPSGFGIYNQHGFTLIEIMITLFILSVGILAMANLQTAAIKGDTLAGHLTLATSLAANQSEDLSGRSFDDPDLDPGNHGSLSCNRFWIGWSVTPDIPLAPLTHDTNGQPMAPFPISKTIDIVVFRNAQAFDDAEKRNRILTLSLVKTRSL